MTTLNSLSLPIPAGALHGDACGAAFRAGLVLGAIEALLVVALAALIAGAWRAAVRGLREAAERDRIQAGDDRDEVTHG